MKTTTPTVDGIEIPIEDIGHTTSTDLFEAHWGATILDGTGGRVVAFGNQGLTSEGAETSRGLTVFTKFLLKLKPGGVAILAQTVVHDEGEPYSWAIVLDTDDVEFVRSLLDPIVKKVWGNPYYPVQHAISLRVCEI